MPAVSGFEKLSYGHFDAGVRAERILFRGSKADRREP
jgi:hypothetical protein